MYKKNKNVIKIVNSIINMGRITITSRELSEITGKEHRNVTRDIREEIERLSEDGIETSRLFVLSSWENSRGKNYPEYQITSQGILHMLARYGRYNYQLRYDLMDIASKLDYHLFKRW